MQDVVEYQNIREQLEDYCDCIGGYPEETWKQIYERDLNELIHLISLITCWEQQPCETFLNSERQEIVDLYHYKKCGCDAGIIEFKPYYRPYEADTMNVKLVELLGVEETVIEIDPSDVAYSETFKLFRINIGKYVKNGKCECRGKYKLIFEYVAGYELLPDCLLQLFCDLLHVMYDKNRCDCSACQACKGDSLDNDDVVIEYVDGDEVSPNLKKYLDALIAAGYKKQLGLMSICSGKNYDVWGCVI